MAKTWTNWVGNQSFEAADIVQAQNESDVVSIIKDAANRDLNVRVAGSGHSFTPVVETTGIVIEPVGLTGIKSVDKEKARATMGAGTTIKEIGEPLWEAGFGLRNQGDIEAQRIAGAIATGTHGSGTQFGSFSAAMVGSILRVGDTTNHPGPIESMTPWVSESKITGQTTTTAISTEDAGTIASTTKYLIPDPMDVAPHMHSALDSACDYWLARIRGVKAEEAFGLYQRDLRLAMEQDQLAPLSGRSRYVWHDGGWRSPLLPDVG